MERVRRELFVPERQRHLSYENIPLPVGMGQTISQPFIVALMTEALELKPQDKVLEVGTGTGYQAAVLAELAGRVITVERLEPLARAAERLLNTLGYNNIVVHLATEAIGWPDEAPYDGIIVTAGAPRVPQELLHQLADGGRLVIPVGSRFEQDLLKIVKQGTEVTTTDLGPCRFVPLIGRGCWSEEGDDFLSY